MGRRKSKLGRHHKNYERKRQAQRRNNVGRPRKAGQLSPSAAVPANVSPNLPHNNDIMVSACIYYVNINKFEHNYTGIPKQSPL